MARSLSPFFRNLPASRTAADMDPFLVMRRQMNRLFDDVFGDFGLPGVESSAIRQMAAPKIDVSETDRELRIAAELPGVKEDDIEVMLDDDSLTIRGEIKQEHENQDQNRNYHVRERIEGAFSRTLALPFRADPGKVQASFRDGVLSITMPKPEEAQRKQQRIHLQRDAGTSGAASSPSGQSSAGTASSGRERTSAGTTSSSGSSSAEERTKETAAE
jgi:HSP20 family protein